MRLRNSMRWVAAVAMAAAATIAIKGAQLFNPGSNVPGVIVSDRNGIATYDPATTVFSVTNSATATLRQADNTGYTFPPPPGAVAVNANISNAGALAGGTVNVGGSGLYPGTLVTGNLFEFGYQRFTDPSAVKGYFDRFQFRGEVTGGSLASTFYQGRDLGVTVDVLYDTADSAYTSFTAAFLGHRTKVNIDPIECNGVIGDYVWRDANSDGVQQPTPTEQGISGVNVTLTGTDSTGKVYSQSTTTNGSGAYEFTKLCSGTYRVTVDVPGGTVPTSAFQGNAVSDSNGQVVPGDTTKVYADATLTNTARQDRTIDFGFRTPPVCTGVVGNYVWHDLNRNGLQDLGEPGIEGVRVNLLDQFGNAFVPARTTVTDAQGHYQFEGLCGGSYTVDVDESTLPGGGFTWTPSTQFSGTAVVDEATDEDDSNGGNAGEGFVLSLPTSSSSNLTIDFGYATQCAAVIGDKVWYDANGNGLQDMDEPGIGGVKVTAFSTGDDNAFGTSDDVNAGSSTTDANGNYLITGLCAGTYKLVVSDVPAQYGAETLTFAPEGSEPSSNPTADSNGNGYIVTLTSDLPGDAEASNLTIDFGYLAACTGTLGDYVWNDDNRNGVQDATETGLAGAHVIVRRLSDNAVVSDTTTDASGFYQATGLCPGSYRVEVTGPAGYVASPTGQGTAATDSNSAPAVRTLTLGDMNDATIDFGFYFPSAPSIAIVKTTNGVDNANASLYVGTVVTWSYQVTNTGNVALSNVTVTDDNGTAANTADDFVVGTLASLAPGASATLTATGSAILGTYRNIGSVTGVYNTTTVSASEPDGYVGISVPPPPTPGLTLTKTANKNTVVFGESVTYTYVVTNTGTVTLTNVVVKDDNATPSYTSDDFIVGTIPSLAAGASVTLTATVVPPTKLCNTDTGGHTRNCGMIVTKHSGNYTKFTYLQAKDHRGDFSNWTGWSGRRAYARRTKFHVIDKTRSFSKDVDATITANDVSDDNSEYESAFTISVDKGYVASSDGSVSMPHLYHKKGWDTDWKTDWDWRSGDSFRARWWDDDKWGHDNDEDYDYTKNPKPCPTVSTNVAVATGYYGTTVVKATDKETVQIVAPAPAAPYKTYTQGGWGAKPSGNNPGAFLAANFSRIAVNGAVTIGGTRTLKFTSASAIEKFLPQGGTPARLTASYVNPTVGCSVLEGQVLTLQLNVAFSAAGLTRQGLGTLTVVSGELSGSTVNEVLTLANAVLGGGSLPTGLTLSELNDIVTRINENFDGGTQNNGFLAE